MIKALSNQIKKSPLDDRLYRYIKLHNSMRCLLIHDKDAEKSSATMQVSSGSLCDPRKGINNSKKSVEGLAHFCEHMLFLGTKKYPVENYYKNFISEHGGQKNAATGEDYTYYYFDVKSSQFTQALDIFSQFFKDPLFTESASTREMNAVDNEFKKNLSNEARGTTQIEKSHLSVPGSLLNRFQTGNLETLQREGIMDDLKEFYFANYSSNLMNLVLIGRQSLDELEHLAVQNFKDIEDRNLPDRDFSNEVVFDAKHSYKKLVKVIPGKEVKSLEIKWTLPASQFYSRSKSHAYLPHVLGHEGPNSLLSVLVKESLATGLIAGTSPRLNGAFDQLYVKVSLSEQGEREYLRVLEIVYMFINQLKQEGFQPHVYQDMQTKHKLDFDNITKMRALTYANSLAKRM